MAHHWGHGRADSSMKKSILLYGLLGGVLIALLRLIEYRFLVVEHSVEIYGGLIAALFAALGIWLGIKLTTPRETVVLKEVAMPAAQPFPSEPFAADAQRLEALRITPSELEILQLIAAGLSTREIAGRIFVSENTGQDAFEPPVRQVERPPAHPGRPDRKRAWVAAVNAAGQPRTNVLVVGAGPTGLTLAACLLRHGVAVRVIDRAVVPPEDRSRAVVVQPRTVELFDDIGIAAAAIEAGITVESVNLFAPSGRSASALFNNRSLDTQYANILVLPQDETERLLGELVVHTGGAIERGVELTELTQDGSAAHVTLRHADGHTEQVDVDWVAGCDGAHSAVRRLVGAAFPGVTYADECLLGDVVLDWKIPDGQISLCPQKDGFLLAFPLRGARPLPHHHDPAAERQSPTSAGWNRTSFLPSSRA